MSFVKAVEAVKASWGYSQLYARTTFQVGFDRETTMSALAFVLHRAGDDYTLEYLVFGSGAYGVSPRWVQAKPTMA